MNRHFRSLGNALYPELRAKVWLCAQHFRSLGNALYPEPGAAPISTALDFRSLGNALYPELLDGLDLRVFGF